MIVKIIDKEIEVENDINNVGFIFKEVERIIEKTAYAFSHMDIDGVEVYDNYYPYIMQNIDNIEIIRVKLKGIDEISRETLIFGEKYLTGALDEIEKLGDDLYKGSKEDSWVRLYQLVEGIQWFLNSFNLINHNISKLSLDKKLWESYSNQIHMLKSMLKDINEAIEDKDKLAVGDIVLYEILPLYRDMLIVLKEFEG